MTDPLEPPSPLASRLFQAERARPDAHADEAARILARVGATVGAVSLAATAAHAGSAAKLGLTAKAAPWIVLAFAAGSGTGAALHAVATRAPSAAAVPAPAPPPAPAVAPSTELVAPELPALLPSRVENPAPAPAAPSADATLAAERALIDRARTALTRGQPAAALEALDEHTKVHPRGRLAEEREALAIQALSALQRPDSAARRAAAFRRAHPTSVFLPAIDLAVGPAERIDGGQ